MKKTIDIITPICGGALLLAGAVLHAEGSRAQTQTRGTVLSVPSAQTPQAPSVLPHRSMTKRAVRRQYGDPAKVHAAVGDPPITRWDYPGFRVFFEYDLVLHAVVPGAFPRIDHRNQLISDN